MAVPKISVKKKAKQIAFIAGIALASLVVVNTAAKRLRIRLLDKARNAVFNGL